MSKSQMTLKRGVMTAPNIITMLRMIGAIPIAVMLARVSDPRRFSPSSFRFWIIIWAGLSISDFIDGQLARLTNQASAWGAFLDPLADKLLVYSTGIAMLVRYWSLSPISAYCFGVCLIFVGYLDVVSTIDYARRLRRMISALAHSNIAPNYQRANIFGKGKTVCCILGLSLLLFGARESSLNRAILMGGASSFLLGGYLAVRSLAYKRLTSTPLPRQN